MSRTTILIPTGTSVGSTSVSLGMIHTMEHKGIRPSVFKPIAQPHTGDDASDQTTTIVRASSSTTTAVEPLKMSRVEGLLSSNQRDMLTEEIVAGYHANTKDAEIVLVEGLVPTRRYQFTQSLDYEIAKVLNAEIVSVISQGTDAPEQSKERIELTRNNFGGARNTNITDVIVNKPNVSIDGQGRTRPDLSEIFDGSSKAKVNNVNPAKLQESSPLLVLDAVPWSFDLIATRAIDMTRHLNAAAIDEGDINTRRVKPVIFYAHSIPHILGHPHAGSLLMTSVDRSDVLMAACLVAMNGIEIGAPLLTGGYEMDTHIPKLCGHAFATDLPVSMVNIGTWQIFPNLQSFSLEIPADDRERIEKVQECVASYINANWIESLTVASERGCRLSLLAFRYQLTELACKAGKRIVLSEGDEPRTIKTAVICAGRGTVTCVLLGNPAGINRVTASQGVELGTETEIVDPEVVRESYIGRLVELRKNKDMTETVAREQLKDNVVPGTLMLKQDKVDGLVSGAVYIIANTIHPPLQLIKTAPGNSLVSSVFFMLLSEQVHVYGGCAINPGPTVEQLAETAIQSADSATAFGTEPHVAMPSYFVGTSGAGSDTEKVREATCLAQERRSDLMIDGPLQHDAAVIADAAKSKASGSSAISRTTALILPDLNIGNTTYKAVQRFTDLIPIGPVLQGMCRPANSLFRGALVGDIVYIITLTATQPARQQ